MELDLDLIKTYMTIGTLINPNMILCISIIKVKRMLLATIKWLPRDLIIR